MVKILIDSLFLLDMLLLGELHDGKAALVLSRNAVCVTRTGWKQAALGQLPKGKAPWEEQSTKSRLDSEVDTEET